MNREDQANLRKPQAPTRSKGEEERDNDAHRPDGSTGTSHDSTAQKTARDKGHE
ncbi:hypothetical protein [Pseudomonas sp. CM27]|uniref:hypothetical protein n=1 Tax=Pseudomonas sp. CM27 TaxID=2738452 RepID=UPI001553AF93|nr:hypothetical protein [Pseudomonas sp. CM27]NQD74791.1 hypothetical protein [Pseudomonas sp. CM27]